QGDEHKNREQQNDTRPASRQDPSACADQDRRHCSYAFSPMRPAGLTSRTISIKMNGTALAMVERRTVTRPPRPASHRFSPNGVPRSASVQSKPTAKLEKTPIRSDAASAPSIEPRPPTTTTTKIIMPSSWAMVGLVG